MTDKANELSDLMYGWRKGWPEFIFNLEKDKKIIEEIAGKCARIAQVSLDEEAGYMRIKQALATIALWCKYDRDYRDKNLAFINSALEIIVQRIGDAKRKDREYYNTSKERQETERLMEESRLRSKKWVEENWTEELEEGYQEWKASEFKIVVKPVN